MTGWHPDFLVYTEYHDVLALLSNLISLGHLKWLTLIYDGDLDILKEYLNTYKILKGYINWFTYGEK